MAETQKMRIKRIGQFLFDNAHDILRQLKKSDNYRSISISFDMFKYGVEEDLQIELKSYDSTTTHHALGEEAICIERFESMWERINEETGTTPPPEPTEVRKKL